MKRKKKTVLIFQLTEFISLEARWGPIAPISSAIKLWNVGRRRVYRWVQRGNIQCCRVWGQIFVPVSQPVILRGKPFVLPLESKSNSPVNPA